MEKKKLEALLETARAEMDKMRTELEAKIALLSADSASMREAIKKSQAEQTRLQTELNKVRSEKDELAKELYALRTKDESVQAELERLKYENSKNADKLQLAEGLLADSELSLEKAKKIVETKTEAWEREKGRADKASTDLKRELTDNEKLTGLNKVLVSALE